jgi:hypothetical protein
MDLKNTRELDAEMARTREQLLHLAERALSIGKEAEALRLYRAFRFLNGDPEVSESEMKNELVVRHNKLIY